MSLMKTIGYIRVSTDKQAVWSAKIRNLLKKRA